MKKTIYLILVLVLASGIDAYSQRIPVGRLREMVPTRESKPEVTKKGTTPLTEKATIYPGALRSDQYPTSGMGDHYGGFYTDDFYEKVMDYYLREVGVPNTNEYGYDIFRYKECRYGERDYVEIHTNSRTDNPRGMRSALEELKDISSRGLLSNEDYNKIYEKYSKIRGYWKTNFCDDIYKKHKERLDYSIIYDNMFAESQRLGLAGKRDEAIAFLELERKKIEELMALNNSPRIVDEWIKCLDEIAEAAEDKKNYWNILIHIWRTGKG